MWNPNSSASATEARLYSMRSVRYRFESLLLLCKVSSMGVLVAHMTIGAVDAK